MILEGGITWIGVTGFNIFAVGKGLGLSWNRNKLIAVGNGPNNFATSTDGITWSGLGKNIFDDATGGNGIAYVELFN